jgi:hypothetical protein
MARRGNKKAKAAKRKDSPVQWAPIRAETKAKAGVEDPLSILGHRTSPVPARPPRRLPFDALPEEEERTLIKLAHYSLANRVGINEDLPMHCRFDAVAPYVEYKRGDDLSKEKQFPEREVDTPAELTDRDGDGQGRKWMPYMPRKYTCVTPPTPPFPANRQPSSAHSMSSTVL